MYPASASTPLLKSTCMSSDINSAAYPLFRSMCTRVHIMCVLLVASWGRMPAPYAAVPLEQKRVAYREMEESMFDQDVESVEEVKRSPVETCDATTDNPIAVTANVDREQHQSVSVYRHYVALYLLPSMCENDHRTAKQRCQRVGSYARCCTEIIEEVCLQYTNRKPSKIKPCNGTNCTPLQSMAPHSALHGVLLISFDHI